MGRRDLVCAAGYSWYQDVRFSRADQPLATEAPAADTEAMTLIRNRRPYVKSDCLLSHQRLSLCIYNCNYSGSYVWQQ